MPTFKTYMHGNLPVEVEVSTEGEFLSASVETKKGIVYLDLDGDEEAALMRKHAEKVMETIAVYWVEKADYDRRAMRDYDVIGDK
jgi:hypothetical protein